MKERTKLRCLFKNVEQIATTVTYIVLMPNGMIAHSDISIASMMTAKTQEEAGPILVLKKKLETMYPDYEFELVSAGSFVFELAPDNSIKDPFSGELIPSQILSKRLFSLDNHGSAPVLELITIHASDFQRIEDFFRKS